MFSKFYFLTVFCSAFSPLSLVSLKTGLEILAFPCNQFGAQEPGNNEEILEFACTRYKAEFPIFDKVEARLSSWYPVSYFKLSIFLSIYQIEVNGENASPVYKFLKAGRWMIFTDDIQWNFAKFLVDKNGKVADRYYPTTSPLTIEVKSDILQLTLILKAYLSFTACIIYQMMSLQGNIKKLLGISWSIWILEINKTGLLKFGWH